MLETKMLRRIFTPKWRKVIGEWRKLRDMEFHNLYSTQNVVMIIKSMRMR
jgi:hypothetical protein